MERCFSITLYSSKRLWKLDAFRASIGETILSDEDVDIQADYFIGKQGLARLSVGEYEGRKRNKVAAWLVPTTPKATTPPSNTKKDADDDDLPF